MMEASTYRSAQPLSRSITANGFFLNSIYRRSIVAFVAATTFIIFAISSHGDSSTPRRVLTGRDIVAELMENRKEKTRQRVESLSDNSRVGSLSDNSSGGSTHSNQGTTEVLDLGEQTATRTQFGYRGGDHVNAKVTLRHGSSARAVVAGLESERTSRWSSKSALPTGQLPNIKAVPLVVLVAGFGAEQAWPAFLHLDGARVPVLAACTDGGDIEEPTFGNWFDLVLLLPHGDKSSVLPCSGSQGCPKDGINLGPSGLNVVHGTAAASMNEDLLSAEALRLFDKTAHSVLVVVSASALVPASALRRLIAAVKPSLVPGTLDLAVPVVSGPGNDSEGNSLEHLYDVSDPNFAAHPLNAARVQMALDSLPVPLSHIHFDSGIFAEQHKGEDWNGLSAVALSPRAVSKLLELPISGGGISFLQSSLNDKGLAHGLHKIAKSAPELECGIVRRAFAYSNYGYRSNVRHVLKSKSHGVAKSPPAMEAENKGAHSTLLAICAAGVPDKTVGAIFVSSTVFFSLFCGRLFVIFVDLYNSPYLS
jgi:hypothetical protein